MLHKILGLILGLAWMLHFGSAHAFTLIIIPPTQEEQSIPSTTITEVTTLVTQIQPIAGAIRSQLLGNLRLGRTRKVSSAGLLLAANDYALSRSDVDLLAAASSGSSAGSTSVAAGTHSLWISSTYNSLENDFFRTRFHGDTQNVVVGYDVTRADRYVLGVAVSREASNFTTDFNAGNERTRGFNVSPYFAYLLSDAWSLDASIGYGAFDTRQSRSLATPLGVFLAESDVASTREFVSTNVTHTAARGDWRFTESMGFLGAKRKQDPYEEDLLGTTVGTVSPTSRIVRQWNLSGEVTHGRGQSENFLGLLYERTRNPPKVEFATGEQPANDPDSVLLTAGWRYFGKGLSANFVFSSRQAQDQVNEYGFSMTLRVDL